MYVLSSYIAATEGEMLNLNFSNAGFSLRLSSLSGFTVCRTARVAEFRLSNARDCFHCTCVVMVFSETLTCILFQRRRIVTADRVLFLNLSLKVRHFRFEKWISFFLK